MTELHFVTKEPINKGWSKDKKYCATDEKGIRYFLRISDIQQYDAKKFEFHMMEKAASLGISMCEPLAFGTCEEGVYSVQSWIDGVSAEEIVPALPTTAQYTYGFEAGRILRAIHSVPVPETNTRSVGMEDWENRFNRKLDDNIKKYNGCPIQYENGQAFIDYIDQNRHLLKNRPLGYLHGDYHVGNMMLDDKGRPYIIDFDRSGIGDPWKEFNRIVWCAQCSHPFASGMVNGYFQEAVPLEFWKLLALYISGNALSSVCWAIPFGQDEVDVMLNQARDILSWYDNMQNVIPTWYSKGYF